MEEGYNKDYKQQFGSKSRKTILKSGIEVTLSDIPKYFTNQQAILDINDYHRWKKLGFPRANYEECDNRLIELVECLKDYDDFYNRKESII